MKKKSPNQLITLKPAQRESWQQVLAESLSKPADLLAYLALKPEDLGYSLDAKNPFDMRVPRPFMQRMQKGNPKDPLLLQVLATGMERAQVAGFSQDPLAESSQIAAEGVLHKYPGRVLLTVTGACAVHCRYCFRRHFPYADVVPNKRHWQAALDYISKDTSIREVILSGGDPLIWKDEVLADLICLLSQVDHLDILRIHTRLPIVIPQRVTERLLETLQLWPRQCVLVVHTNHPAEIDAEVRQALRRLSSQVDWLLNQSVLLAGVNDDAKALAELSRQLFAAKTLPYYLHALDKVAGAAHFEVPPDKSQHIMKALREQLPGYLVPTFVSEVPHTLSKQPL